MNVFLDTLIEMKQLYCHVVKYTLTETFSASKQFLPMLTLTFCFVGGVR
jgi:hypothetical protein